MTDELRNRLTEAISFARVFVGDASRELFGSDDTRRKQAALQLERALMRLEEAE